MKSKALSRYYVMTVLGVLLASCYPFFMGICVIRDMLVSGTVFKEDYPKYIIPYTPICIAVLTGVLLLPLCANLPKRFALLAGSVAAIAVFFVLEILFEQQVVVTSTETVSKLEDWQMFMCYAPPDGWGETTTTYKTQTAAEI